MGTKNKSLNEYLELWKLFEEEIKKSKLLDSNTLSGFAKYYEKISDADTKNDYAKVYDRLKKMKKRKESYKKSVPTNTYLELENFYKTIKKSYFKHELLEDEDIEHWFD